jgi:hypothetical protein
VLFVKLNMKPTKNQCYQYWTQEMKVNPEMYMDCGEINTTTLGENAAQHFDCMSDEGNSDIEQDIFDWAVDFIKFARI